MSISKETLQAIISDYGGFELSDDELELVRPEVEGYLEAMAGIADLDLSDTMSSRLLRAAEGGTNDA